MPRRHNYSCTRCGTDTPRHLLTVKNVRFLEIGEKPKQLRSRNTAWLCPLCVAKDEDWNRPPQKVRPPRLEHLRPDQPIVMRQPVFEEPDLESALAMGSPWAPTPSED